MKRIKKLISLLTAASMLCSMAVFSTGVAASSDITYTFDDGNTDGWTLTQDTEVVDGKLKIKNHTSGENWGSVINAELAIPTLDANSEYDITWDWSTDATETTAWFNTAFSGKNYYHGGTNNIYGKSISISGNTSEDRIHIDTSTNTFTMYVNDQTVETGTMSSLSGLSLRFYAVGNNYQHYIDNLSIQKAGQEQEPESSVWTLLRDGSEIDEENNSVHLATGWDRAVRYTPNLAETGTYEISWTWSGAAGEYGAFSLLADLCDGEGTRLSQYVLGHRMDGQTWPDATIFKAGNPTTDKITINTETGEWTATVNETVVSSGTNHTSNGYSIVFSSPNDAACYITDITVTKVGANTGSLWTLLRDGSEIDEENNRVHLATGWDRAVRYTPNLAETGTYEISWTWSGAAGEYGAFSLLADLCDGEGTRLSQYVLGHRMDTRTWPDATIFYAGNPTTDKVTINTETGEWTATVNGTVVSSGTNQASNGYSIVFSSPNDAECYINNISVRQLDTNTVPKSEILSYSFDDGNLSGISGDCTYFVDSGSLKVQGSSKKLSFSTGELTSGVIKSSIDLNFADVAGANGSDGNCFLNIGWTSSVGIDSVPRAGYRFNYNSGVLNVTEINTWSERTINSDLDAWYTMTAVIDLDSATADLSLKNRSTGTELASYSTGFSGDLSKLDMWVRIPSGSCFLMDNFTVDYSTDIMPDIASAIYTAENTATALDENTAMTVSPYADSIIVEFNQPPSSYNIEDYVSVTGNNGALVPADVSISGKELVIIPNDPFMGGDSYNINISKDIYMLNGMQLGVNVSYPFTASESEVIGEITAVTTPDGADITDLSGMKENQSFKVNVSARNATSHDAELALIVTYYDEDMMLTANDVTYITYGTDTRVMDFTKELTLKNTSASKVKIFLWRGFEEYVPICAEKVFE